MKMDADVSLFTHSNQLTARTQITNNKGNMYLARLEKDGGNLKPSGWRNMNNDYRCDTSSWIVFWISKKHSRSKQHTHVCKYPGNVTNKSSSLWFDG